MKLLRTLLFLFAALGLVLVSNQPAGAAKKRPAARTWAPVETATVHPGVQVTTEAGQCTSNFIYQSGADVLIGMAAHCAGSDSDPTATNGCDSGSLPLGSPVEIEGASQPGSLVYSSWLTMQRVGETDEETCDYNDFALVRVHPDDVASINPSVPFWGGPTAVGGPTQEGDEVYSYGNSSLRLGITELSPKSGYSLGMSPEGWSHTVYTVTPGIPGDSGSGFLNANGEAIGTLSTVAIAPLAGSNGVGDLSKELAYANSHGFSVTLVPGDVAFTPGLPL